MSKQLKSQSSSNISNLRVCPNCQEDVNVSYGIEDHGLWVSKICEKCKKGHFVNLIDNKIMGAVVHKKYCCNCRKETDLYHEKYGGPRIDL